MPHGEGSGYSLFCAARRPSKKPFATRPLLSNEGNGKVIPITPTGKGCGYARRHVRDQQRYERHNPRLP